MKQTVMNIESVSRCNYRISVQLEISFILMVLQKMLSAKSKT